MTVGALKFIYDALNDAGINYEFIEYSSDIGSVETYWVGEYSEVEVITEDGKQETQFILTGTTKGKWIELESQKNKIEKTFPAIQGRTAILDNTSGVAVFYGNAFPVPTGDAFLKRMQINLTIKEWKVN